MEIDSVFMNKPTVAKVLVNWVVIIVELLSTNRGIRIIERDLNIEAYL